MREELELAVLKSFLESGIGNPLVFKGGSALGWPTARHQPGLFFRFDGEAFDLRGTIATFSNIPVIRTKR